MPAGRLRRGTASGGHGRPHRPRGTPRLARQGPRAHACTGERPSGGTTVRRSADGPRHPSVLSALAAVMPRRRHPTAAAAAGYAAFMSCSHADGRLAPRLQEAVETYAAPWYRRRLLRIFRDETSLGVTPHLWPTIRQALDRSRFLILMASP